MPGKNLGKILAAVAPPFVLALSLAVAAHAETLRVMALKPDNSIATDAGTVSLYGIGTPSAGTPFGKETQAFISEHVRPGRSIDVDRKGASSVIIRVGNHNLNHMLLEAGLAWVNRSLCLEAFCRRWLIAEHYAVKTGSGLWSVVNEEHPWQWGPR